MIGIPAITKAGISTRILRPVLFATWLILIPFLAKLYISLDPSPDQSIFDYIAWLRDYGYTPYAESFEVNWPGAVILHAAAQQLFPGEVWSWRAFDFGLLQILTLGAALFVYRAGFALAPAIVLLLYPILYITSGYWMAGQRDIIATGFIIAASALLIGPGRGRWLPLVLAGAIIGFATLIRPTYLAFLAGAVVLEVALPNQSAPNFRQRLERPLALIVGAAGLCAIVGLIGLSAGNLDDWFQQAVQFSLSSYQEGGPAIPLGDTLVSAVFRSWHWITALAGLGLIAFLHRYRISHALLLILGTIATVLLSYFVQNKGFGYHLGGLLLCFTLLVAILIDSLLRALDGPAPPIARLSAALALMLCAGVATAGTGMKLARQIEIPNGDVRQARMVTPQSDCLSTRQAAELATMIHTTTKPQDTILILGCQTQVGYLAKRVPATRFGTSTSFLTLKYNSPKWRAWVREFDADLKRHPPAYVLIEASHLRDATTILDRGRTSAAIVLAAAFVRDGYDPMGHAGSAVLLRRRSLVAERPISRPGRDAG